MSPRILDVSLLPEPEPEPELEPEPESMTGHEKFAAFHATFAG